MNVNYLREVLHYDPATGKWRWLKSRGGNRGEAGTLRKDGRHQIRLEGKCYLASRLAWLYMTGKWPTQQIDHIDRKPGNDKWTNLRSASPSENLKNRVVPFPRYPGLRWQR
jgi:hypothetical protein